MTATGKATWSIYVVTLFVQSIPSVTSISLQVQGPIHRNIHQHNASRASAHTQGAGKLKAKVETKKAESAPLVTPTGLGSLDLQSVDSAFGECYSSFTDGTYAYMIPTSAPKVARFSLSSFNTVEILDLSPITGHHESLGGFAVGAYGYLIGHATHTKIVRFLLSDFSTASVEVLDTAGRFWGGFAAGAYGYAVPYTTGSVVRFPLSTFDTTEVLDVSAVDSDLTRFADGFTDGVYGYLVPHTHTKLARFSLSSFSAVQVLDTGLGDFVGGFTDGTYGYLVPQRRQHQNAVRFSLSDFSVSSMQLLDVSAVDSDLSWAEFHYGFSDGIYGYLVPVPGGKVPKFRLSDFTMVEILDVSSAATGFYGGFAAGGYGYMNPKDGESGRHGRVVRFQVEAPTPTTPSPTSAPTPSPTTVVAGVGDPHLVNTHGQKFDLFQAGYHTLINIPRWARQRANFLVQARASRAGAGCADLYFTEINISGTWAQRHKAADLRWVAEAATPGKAKWMKFHNKISVKIVHGHTAQSTKYLNILVKGLGKTKAAVGGLLGEDDHTAAATPDVGCKKLLTL